MASNGIGRGYPRGGRTPQFLTFGLLVVICILAFNYWNVSSRSKLLQKQVQEMTGTLEELAMKKVHLEKRSEALQSQIADANHANTNLRQQKETCDKETELTKRENSDIAERLQLANNDKNVLLDTLEKEKLNATQTIKLLADQREQYEKLKMTHEMLQKNTLSEKDNVIQDLHEQQQILTNNLHAASEEKQQLESMVQGYKTQLERLQMQASNCQQQLQMYGQQQRQPQQQQQQQDQQYQNRWQQQPGQGLPQQQQQQGGDPQQQQQLFQLMQERQRQQRLQAAQQGVAANNTAAVVDDNKASNETAIDNEAGDEMGQQQGNRLQYTQQQQQQFRQQGLGLQQNNQNAMQQQQLADSNQQQQNFLQEGEKAEERQEPEEDAEVAKNQDPGPPNIEVDDDQQEGGNQAGENNAQDEEERDGGQGGENNVHDTDDDIAPEQKEFFEKEQEQERQRQEDEERDQIEEPAEDVEDVGAQVHAPHDVHYGETGNDEEEGPEGDETGNENNIPLMKDNNIDGEINEQPSSVQNQEGDSFSQDGGADENNGPGSQDYDRDEEEEEEDEEQQLQQPLDSNKVADNLRQQYDMDKSPPNDKNINKENISLEEQNFGREAHEAPPQYGGPPDGIVDVKVLPNGQITNDLDQNQQNYQGNNDDDEADDEEDDEEEDENLQQHYKK